MYIIGIDPGKNGAIAALNNGKIISLEKMPSTPQELIEYFRFLGFPKVLRKDELLETYILIEKVHSMPTDGVRSAFTFGRHIGQFDMLFAFLNIKYNEVPPREWQKHFILGKDPNESKYEYKKRIKDLASKKAPILKKNKISLTNCDAYLIALYGFELQKQKGILLAV